MSVGVVVDSAANLPSSFVTEYGITVVPMSLAFGDRVYRDGVDLVPGDFYEMLASERTSVSTSGASAGDFAQTFAEVLALHDSVVCVTVAAGVSVTNASATIAARGFDGRVRVVDSQSASMAEGFVALAAASGQTLEDAVARGVAAAGRSGLVATIETFEFLRRSGRVNALQAFAATTIGVKPVFALRRGVVEQLARPRSRARAIERLIAEIPEDAGQVAVVHAACESEARALASRLQGERGGDPLVAEFTPLMGAHTGPGLIGIAYL